MKFKTTVLVAVTVIGLATGANRALDPVTLDQHERDRQEQSLDQAADADQRTKETMRDNGNAHADAEHQSELIPGEHRPPERPRIKIRLRLL